jgi:hypothetical protein
LDIQNAIGFIEKNGTLIEKYRLHFLAGNKRNDDVPLKYLRNLQNEDGGFPYNNEKSKVSCLNNTNDCLDMIIELKLDPSDVLNRTIEYLLGIQNEDGSWSENNEIIQYGPTFWDMPNDLKTTMWLTADIARHLIQLSYKETQAVQRAADFLLMNRDEEWKFAGFLHSTWIAIGVFGQLMGSKSEIVERALNVFNRNMEKLNDSAGDLAWCLECFRAAGLTEENPTVKKCVDQLVNLQQENGSWLSSDGDEFVVSTTINALKALRSHKVW